MSVRTTFDDRKEEVKDYLGKAWGYEDIKPEFIDELIQMIADLTKMKRKL
jgi:hypothetical protein